MSERGVHSLDCLRYPYSVHFNRYKGFVYESCFDCDYFWHEPLRMLGPKDWQETPTTRGDTYQSSSSNAGRLFEDPSYISAPPSLASKPCTPILKNPVPIAFWPVDAIARDDSKDEGGISFARLWSDEVARTVWLGVKPFMLTSQYFRAHCIGIAEQLRKRPGRLLDEFVSFNVSDCFTNGFSTDFWAQLVPYLIWALEEQQAWPYWHLPGVQELKWQRVYKTKVA